ncbi:MAG: amidohydrolase family protein [Dehalococcoidia bacterium]|nr:amidohydrolase family protein [Dehalococcoidia bacterium]
MQEYPVIDAHLHTFHTPEAGRQAMSNTPSKPDISGTIEDAVAALKASDVAGALMVNTIPLAYMWDAAVAKLSPNLTPSQREDAEHEIQHRLLARLERRNQWTCAMAQEHPNFYATITLDPIMSPDAMRQEIRDKVTSHDARAIKLHPPIGRFFPNHQSLWPIYETAQTLDVPIVFHVGAHPHPDNPELPVEYSKPEHFEDVATAFPKLRLVLAHMGVGPAEWYPHLFQPYYNAALALARRHPHLCFDVSAAVGAEWPQDKLLAMIRQIGAERVLFGSDFPWWDPGVAQRGLEQLGLSAEEKRFILYENAQRMFEL